MRRLALGTFLAAALAGGLAVAIDLRQREEADRLRAEAERLLGVGIEAAASLEDLQASRARMLLEEALELHAEPRTEGLLAYATALVELAKGRPERAREELTGAQVDGDARLHVLAARIAIAMHDEVGARRELDAALRLARRDPRALALHAELLLAEAPARALAIASELIERHPEVATLYNLRGLAHEAQGDPAQALGDFALALRYDASLAAPYLNRGRLLRAEHRHAEAEESFTNAIERASGSADAWLGRGLSRIAQGDLAGGKVDVERARALAPTEPGPLIALADLVAGTGDFARAIELYRAALLGDGAQAIAWLKLGNALMRLRDVAGARDAFMRATELQPELAAAHNGLGAARMRLGDAAGADTALASAARLDASDPNPLLNLAELRRRQGDGAGARDAWAEALARGYAR